MLIRICLLYDVNIKGIRQAPDLFNLYSKGRISLPGRWAQSLQCKIRIWHCVDGKRRRKTAGAPRHGSKENTNHQL